MCSKRPSCVEGGDGEEAVSDVAMTMSSEDIVKLLILYTSVKLRAAISGFVHNHLRGIVIFTEDLHEERECLQDV